MARPILIVGIGGTGQWVLAHIKKNLLDAYGEIPLGVRLLSLDTTLAPEVAVGGWGRSRGAQAEGGVVDLTSEHIYIGGNAYNYVLQINQGQYPCIASWFNAGWFLSQQGSQGLLNLTIGAGRFRQLGRLAVFYNLAMEAHSILRNALNTGILDIQRETGENNLYAFLTGSLAGGTGAGMFADVAHLIRALAGVLGVAARIRGYFILPQAFDGTTNVGVPQLRTDIIAKAFAAMRENSRFAAEFNYAEGYPMFYSCNENEGDAVLRGHIRSTLFELLY